MAVYVVPGEDLAGVSCEHTHGETGLIDCDAPAHARVKIVEGEFEVSRPALCYEHFEAMMIADNLRPFHAKRGTARAKATGEYEVPGIDWDADTFTLPDVDCNQCGETHRDVRFDKVGGYVVRTAGGLFATVTHHAICPVKGTRIVAGRAPRNGDF
jgi:hypothetical protein